MQWLRALYLWRWQRCKRCINIPKNTSNIINVVTTQRCRCRTNILMNTSSIANVTTMQRCKRYVGISKNVFYNINALISQLGTSCSFDSPGLTSESVVYPGLFAISENNAVGVVPFCFPYTILPLIINYITLTIVSLRNSVRVVLLIARGWRGTSLPRVNVRKEIQRHRCWAFSVKARLQWNLLWQINQKKRNTYGVVPRTISINPG